MAVSPPNLTLNFYYIVTTPLLYPYSDRPPEGLGKSLCFTHFQGVDLTASNGCEWRVRSKGLGHTLGKEQQTNHHTADINTLTTSKWVNTEEPIKEQHCFLTHCNCCLSCSWLSSNQNCSASYLSLLENNNN